MYVLGRYVATEFGSSSFVAADHKARLAKNLDRVLVNSLLTRFPVSFATFEAGGMSDHLRVWTQLRPAETANWKPFKFLNHVTNHPWFLEVVDNVWTFQAPLYHSISALKLFHSKLKSLKSDI